MSRNDRSQIAHYRLLRPLGSGGMGEVFEAEDLRLHRKVALKILPEIWVRDQDQRRRFEREARNLAALDHPNIVTLYSVEDTDDLVFLTMELVSGDSLARAIPEGGMPPETFFPIALQIADALVAAHQRDIVHRDIKSSNIMVCDDGRVKVLDFGLAKRHHPSEAELHESQTLTQEGMMLGTLPYMSPEQVQGNAVDHRTDIFSFGIVLYEMATGERPFKGSSWGDLASAILRDDPPSVTATNTRLPRHLGRIVRHCLEKDVKRRFQTMLDLRNEIDDLRREMAVGDSGISTGSFVWTPMLEDQLPPIWSPRRWLGGSSTWTSRGSSRGGASGTGSRRLTSSPSSARRPGSLGSGRFGADPRAARRPVVVAGVLAALVLLAGASMLWLVGPDWLGGLLPGGGDTEAPAPVDSFVEDPGPARLRTVVLPFENLGRSDANYFAEGVTEEISSRLAQASALAVISRRSLGEDGQVDADFSVEGTVRWDPLATGENARRARVTVRLVRLADGTLLWSESYEHVVDDLFAVQTEIAIEVIRQMDIVLLEPERRAMASQPTENFEAFQAYLQGMELAGRRDPSSSQWQRAVERFERAVDLDPQFALAWAELSEVESLVFHLHIDHTSERLARAKAAVDRALAIDPDLPQGQRALAYYHYWGHRDFDRALVAFEKAAQRLPSDGQVLGGMAYIWRRQGRFEEAADQLRRALEYNPDSRWLAAELGRTLRMLRRYREADHYYARAIELQPDQPGPYRQRAINYLLWHGDLDSAHATLEVMPKPTSTVSLLARYELERMSRHFDEALAALEETTVTRVNTDSETLPKLLLEGQILLMRSGLDEARGSFEAAERELQALLRGTAEDTRLLTALARARAYLGDEAGALEAIGQARELAPIENDAIVGSQVRLIAAEVHATLGQADAAVELLSELLATTTEVSRPLIRIEPVWDPIRDDPGFRALIDATDGQPTTGGQG